MTGVLARELARQGHELHIVSYPNTFLSDEERDLGMQLHATIDIDYPCFKSEPYTETLASVLANVERDHGKLDIIHANYAITHGLAAIVASSILRRRRNDGTGPCSCGNVNTQVGPDAGRFARGYDDTHGIHRRRDSGRRKPYFDIGFLAHFAQQGCCFLFHPAAVDVHVHLTSHVVFSGVVLTAIDDFDDVPTE